MGQQKIRNMEEFAAVSGISRPTLSKYFNDADSVRRSTRERIEAALSQYDYRPNVYAVNQNRRKTRNIGVVVPNLRSFPRSAARWNWPVWPRAIARSCSARTATRRRSAPISTRFGR